jgi:hypothetical protein
MQELTFLHVWSILGARLVACFTLLRAYLRGGTCMLVLGFKTIMPWLEYGVCIEEQWMYMP